MNTVSNVRSVRLSRPSTRISQNVSVVNFLTSSHIQEFYKHLNFKCQVYALRSILHQLHRQTLFDQNLKFSLEIQWFMLPAICSMKDSELIIQILHCNLD